MPARTASAPPTAPSPQAAADLPAEKPDHQTADADGAEPADTSLTSNRGLLLRPLDQAIRDFVEHSETLG